MQVESAPAWKNGWLVSAPVRHSHNLCSFSEQQTGFWFWGGNDALTNNPLMDLQKHTDFAFFTFPSHL